MKRVLSLATLYPNAHSPRFGTFVARQMEALAARGDWDVTIINPIGMPPLALGRYAQLKHAAVDGAEQGVQIYRPRFTLIPRLSGRFNPGRIAAATLPLARKLHAAAPFDLVDAQFFYPDGPAAARIAADLGLPLSIKARGSDISFWGNTPYGQRQMLAAANQAAGLLSVSQALAGDMAEMGMDRGKITVHYTGLDRSLFKPQDQRQARAQIAAQFGLELPADAPVLASVGALIPRKGQRFVIEALPHTPGAQLLLAGTGPDEQELRERARSLGAEQRVHFLGSLNHETMAQVLCASDAMVLPSVSEGLANAWVEAIACGTPIVICDVGGARELIMNPAAGRLVERDVMEIANAVSELLDTPPMPSEVAQAAAHFSWDTNAAKLAEYYERLIL